MTYDDLKDFASWLEDEYLPNQSQYPIDAGMGYAFAGSDWLTFDLKITPELIAEYQRWKEGKR